MQISEANPIILQHICRACILALILTEAEVCIIGAGPAGATLSHFLSKEGIPHYLVDKASFPRDKICGDGITLDVLNVLERISPDLLYEYIAQDEVLPSWGFCFHAPNGTPIRFDFKEAGFKASPFYSTRRLDLDNFLVERLDSKYCHFLPETTVTNVSYRGKGVEVTVKSINGEKTLKANYVVGAEGEKPIVTRHLGLEHYREKQHLIGAIRVYYKNIKGFHENNHLEFFFNKNLLPGYFWVFPLSENEANVGLGMVSTKIAAKKLNLKKMLFEEIENHPRLQEMFEGAEAITKPQGWGLPILTKKRPIAGNRYLLIGDAAGMIEPFTGKGIGPGMMSARIASEHLVDAIKGKELDLMLYQSHMYRYYKTETRTGYTLQKSLQYPIAWNTMAYLANLSFAHKKIHKAMVDGWSKWI